MRKLLSYKLRVTSYKLQVTGCRLGCLALMYVLSFSKSIAQEEKTFIHKGNKSYESGQFDEAEVNYKKAIEKNNGSLKGMFNMADALYKQGKFAESAGMFESIANRKTSSDTLSQAFHNLGNSLLRQKKYEESVNAYKRALKNNPNDEDSRYNLAYAQQMLKKEQQQQQKDKDKKNDQKQDQKKDQQQDDKKEQQKKEDQQQQEQQAKNQISKEDAKRLLEALNNDEKKTQDKLKKQKAKGSKADIEKDW